MKLRLRSSSTLLGLTWDLRSDTGRANTPALGRRLAAAFGLPIQIPSRLFSRRKNCPKRIVDGARLHNGYTVVADSCSPQQCSSRANCTTHSVPILNSWSLFCSTESVTIVNGTCSWQIFTMIRFALFSKIPLQCITMRFYVPSPFGAKGDRVHNSIYHGLIFTTTTRNRVDEIHNRWISAAFRSKEHV